MVILTGAALLSVSVFLNVLLLTMGTVHYYKMADTLEQVQKENKWLKEAAPSPFLLYNENKNVCATILEQNYLTAVSCSPDVQDQHFQLLSGGLLSHLVSHLCVAAQSRKNKMALILTPCNPRSSLQHWECRNHDLLALKDTDLYFNYGNSVNKRVMLYDGNGPWSRWLIYGTHNNICNSCSPLGRDWKSFQESYYFFSHSPGSWDVANQSCISMGSHLVTISSAEEKDYVATIMKTTSYWIGLTDLELEGTWKWVDGTNVGPENRYWHSTEPNGGKNENCAMVSHGMWYDYPCKERHYWVCERKL
ncbi:macrophage mannose receptor 1-like [Sceloporus undulatus]|uniref:macrophage mannose receptor 1-like n=1 Tax=Sceloporus undulatus TaxID=8520 RepID=UPI001C4D3FF6|nr:macrophage mannose receptor 1-like [Sceloporus undulatus]